MKFFLGDLLVSPAANADASIIHSHRHTISTRAEGGWGRGSVCTLAIELHKPCSTHLQVEAKRSLVASARSHAAWYSAGRSLISNDQAARRGEP